MNLKTLLLINTAIFSLVALLHLVRLGLNGKVVFLGAEIPIWLSVVGFLVAGFLAYQNYKKTNK